MSYRKIQLILLLLFLIPLFSFSITLHVKDFTLVFNKNVYLSDIVKEFVPYIDDCVVGKITSLSTFTLMINNKDRNIKLDKNRIKIKYIKVDSLSKRIKEFVKYKVSKIFVKSSVDIKSPLPQGNNYDILLQTYPPVGWTTVKLLKNNKFYRNVSIYCKVSKEVYVAKNDIPSKHTITQNDVQQILLDVTSNYRNIPNKVIGMMSKYYIRKGSIIYSNYLMDPLDVVQGQTVLMILKYKNITINDYGIALSDGRIGDIIRILNIKSRNIVIGKVIQKGIVEVIIK